MFDITGSKHPIVCLPMNGLSDINLAIAVSRSGCLPSLVMTAYTQNHGKIFYSEKLKRDLVRFVSEAQSCGIMLSMTDAFLLQHNEAILDIASKFKITHVEVIPYYGNDSNDYSLEDYIKYVIALKKLNVKIIVKCLSVPVEHISKSLIDYGVIDCIIVKSSKGAGKVSSIYPNLNSLISKAKSLYPNVHIIGCGGISTAEDMKNALVAGASAIGLGTVFAMSKESKLCIENKIKLLSKNTEDLQKIKSPGLSQNGIVFQKHEDWDNENNSVSLEKGISGTGGHVFVGHGIDQITQILSVAEIVDRLTKLDIGLSGGMDTIGG